MASSKEYLDFILDQLSEAEEITFRKMMGEYILYTHGKVFGGIYDDRFLVKNIPAATEMLPEAPMEFPYEGAKPMILVDQLENKTFLAQLIAAMEPKLPLPKKKKK